MPRRLLFAVFLICTSAWAAPFSFSSSFEGGNTEGWTIFTPPSAVGGVGPTAPLTGGFSGSGYLEAEDAANGFLYFIAPGSWSGNLYGGTLSFYLRNLNPNVYQLTGTEPTVRIEGANSTVLYYFNLPGAANDWTYNQLVLGNSPNWRLGSYIGSPVPTSLDIAQTLSNVASIGILADWVSRYAGHPQGDFGPDITGLDEVRLDSVIPEPGAWLLTGAGCALLFFLRKRA